MGLTRWWDIPWAAAAGYVHKTVTLTSDGGTATTDGDKVYVVTRDRTAAADQLNSLAAAFSGENVSSNGVWYPTYKPAGIGGLPSLLLSPSGHASPAYSNSAMAAGNAPFTVFMVADANTVNVASYLYTRVLASTSYNSGPASAMSNAACFVNGQSGWPSGKSSYKPLTTTIQNTTPTPHLWVHRCDGTHANDHVYLDGTLQTEGSPIGGYEQDPTVDTTTTLYFILGYLYDLAPTPTQPYSGRVSEIGVANRYVPDSELASLGRYAQNRYGFTVANAA